MVSETNSDYPALYRNLKRAKQKWALISRVVTREAATPRAAAIFYKVIVQTVLLYGCESWVVTPRMMKILTGFHHRVVRKITGKTAKLENGVWVHPPIADALKKAKMEPMEEYVRARQARMIQWLALRPILPLIEGQAESRSIRWWAQPTVLDPPPAAAAGVVAGEDAVPSP
jgi:hypothetical protein